MDKDTQNDLNFENAGERTYRLIFEYSQDGIVIADDESYYLDANPSACKMLGYTR